jgi:hypothetical protein
LLGPVHLGRIFWWKKYVADEFLQLMQLGRRKRRGRKRKEEGEMEKKRRRRRKKKKKTEKEEEKKRRRRKRRRRKIDEKQRQDTAPKDMTPSDLLPSPKLSTTSQIAPPAGDVQHTSLWMIFHIQTITNDFICT